jgi:WD40 repeat protein
MRAAFSPDGTRLALGGFGNAIAVLGDDGRLLHRLEPLPARADPRGVIYRPDGSGLLTFIVRDPVVREFDLEGRLRRQWPIEAEFLRFGRDGNLLALGPSAEDSRLRVVSVLGSGEADVSRVGVWRQAWETGTDHAGLRAPVALGTLGARFLAYGRKRDIFLQGLGAPGGRSVLLGSHGGDVRSLAVSSDGELLISADEGGELRLWSTSLRRHLASIEGPPIHKYGQTTFEATGRQVAWGSGAAQSSCVWEIDGPPAAPFRCYHVNALDPGSPAFDPQGRWLATPGYSHLTLSRIDSPWARILTGHQEGPIIDLAFSPDGRNLASCARDGLRIWSMEPGREGERRIRLDRPYFAYGAAWMPEGDELILAAPVPGIFRVGLDPDRFTLLMPQPSQSMALGRLATDQSGRKAALTTHYAAESRFMRLFQMDMESGEIQSIQLRGDEEQDPWKGGQRAAGYTWDGRIVTAGDGGTRIWDPATGKLEVLAGGPGTFGVMALNQSGTRLVASLGTDYRDLVFISNSRLLVIDLKSGEQREIHSHGDRLTLAIATDPSGEVIATADVAGTVRVGGIDGSEPYLLLGHKGTVRSVAVSPDRRWVASGSGAEIRLWPIPDLSRRPLHRLPYPELLSLLRSATNLEVREDPASATGFRVESGPFEGWRNAPAW